jgi:hypothetical protein
MRHGKFAVGPLRRVWQGAPDVVLKYVGFGGGASKIQGLFSFIFARLFLTLAGEQMLPEIRYCKNGMDSLSDSLCYYSILSGEFNSRS